MSNILIIILGVLLGLVVVSAVIIGVIIYAVNRMFKGFELEWLEEDFKDLEVM